MIVKCKKCNINYKVKIKPGVKGTFFTICKMCNEKIPVEINAAEPYEPPDSQIPTMFDIKTPISIGEKTKDRNLFGKEGVSPVTKKPTGEVQPEPMAELQDTETPDSNSSDIISSMDPEALRFTGEFSVSQKEGRLRLDEEVTETLRNYSEEKTSQDYSILPDPRKTLPDNSIYADPEKTALLDDDFVTKGISWSHFFIILTVGLISIIFLILILYYR